MLAVTTRPAVRERLTEVSVALGLPQPSFGDSLEDALEAGVESPVLFLDLGSCCRDGNLEHALHTWEAFRPGSEVLLFAPLVDHEAELRAAVRLARATRFVDARLVTLLEFYRDDFWRSVVVGGERAALEAELRSELLNLVRESGRKVRAEAVVLQILHNAARWEQDSMQLAAHAAGTRIRTERQRKVLWKLLRRAGQLPASRLLLIFRVVWYAKLRERGWSAGQIARFLGFGSARHLRLTMKVRLRVSMADLRELGYRQVLQWAAQSISSAPDCRARSEKPWRTLAASLLNPLDDSNN